MPVYQIHRLKETQRQQFRWAPHTSGVTIVKPKDYEKGQVRQDHREINFRLERAVNILDGVLQGIRVQDPACHGLGDLPTITCRLLQIQPSINQLIRIAAARDGPPVHRADGRAHNELGRENIRKRLPDAGLIGPVHPARGEHQRIHRPRDGPAGRTRGAVRTISTGITP